MPRKPYEWRMGAKPPAIEPHSCAKHAILDRYVERYIRVLCALPHRESIHLTLVDGFAGGGLYWDPIEQCLHEGSPIIMLEAAERAERLVNEHRVVQGQRTPLKVNTEFFFVDVDARSVEFLRDTLARSPHARRVGRDVHVLNGRFEKHVDQIISRVLKSSRARRAFFLLDQYGYRDVPLPLMKRILDRLRNAEILVTFAVDTLTQYLSEESADVYRKTFEQVGLTEFVDLDGTLEERATNPAWRWLIQSQLAGAFRSGSGAAFMTPFFNVSETSHRAYWLVHLCRNQRANVEMKALHWEFANHFRHYGRPGLDMLGYDPTRDDDLVGQIRLGFDFDEPARARSIERLREQLPARLDREAHTYDALYQAITNETPAADAMIREVLGELMLNGAVEVKSSDSGYRRSAQRIKSTDLIALPPQRAFFFFNSQWRTPSQ